MTERALLRRAELIGKFVSGEITELEKVKLRRLEAKFKKVYKEKNPYNI